MKTRSLLVLASAAACGCAVSGCGRATASPGENRKEVSLTIYSQDFAMVSENRPVKLEAGRNALHLPGISKELDPNSVIFSWPKGVGAEVVSNTNDLGVNEGTSLLKRYLGQEVELVWHGEDGSEGERIKGILQVADEGNLVVEHNGKMLVNPTATVIVPKRDDIVTIPQLSVDVESKTAADSQVTVAYLTRGLSWSADYTATLDPTSNALNLECWATITNQTGTTFPTAKLTLMAGSPNRAAVAARARAGEFAKFETDINGTPDNSRDKTMADPMSSPETAGELYSYSVGSLATIAQDQMNRVRMLSSTSVPVEKDYSVRINQYNYYGSRTQGRRQNAQLAINFKNTEVGGLGMPLPKGAVRVYEPDAKDNPRYVGAAGIQDTAKGEKVNLTLSNVFDVTSEFRTVGGKKLDKKHYQTDYEVILRNAKKSDVDLRVVQSLYGNWKLANESIKGRKLDASNAQWTVPIPAGGEVMLTYSVVTG